MKYYLICDGDLSNDEIYTTSSGFLKCKGELVLHPAPDAITDPTLISQLDPVLIANAVGAGFLVTSLLLATAFGIRVVVSMFK